jgi:hypothetical protein
MERRDKGNSPVFHDSQIPLRCGPQPDIVVRRLPPFFCGQSLRPGARLRPLQLRYTFWNDGIPGPFKKLLIKLKAKYSAIFSK